MLLLMLLLAQHKPGAHTDRGAEREEDGEQEGGGAARTTASHS